jgi:ubiquinone/menaquinone biosynthesis C-methylase UbiE
VTTTGIRTRLVDRLVDVTARRPSGCMARKTYGGTAGAPAGHEAVFDRLLAATGSLEGKRCLEIGCGGGRLLQRILDNGASSAAALDHSEEMLRLSGERNATALREGRLDLKHGDASRLPWPDESFDVVLSANTFFFIADPTPVLAEIRRVLIPDGRVVIGTVPGPLPKASLRNWWVYVWGTRMHVYDEDTMRAMLQDARFQDISIARIDNDEPLQLIIASS